MFAILYVTASLLSAFLSYGLCFPYIRKECTSLSVRECHAYAAQQSLVSLLVPFAGPIMLFFLCNFAEHGFKFTDEEH